MRSKNHPGVATLLIIMLSSILLIGLMASWRTASLSVESALLCHKLRKEQYAVESLLMYGLGLIKSESINLSQLTPKIETKLYQGRWPLGQVTSGILSATYSAKEGRLVLTGQLFNDDSLIPIKSAQTICQIRPDSQLIVQSWQT